MGDLDNFRLLNTLDLAPTYTSLGLRPELFRDGSDAEARSFDAAMRGPGDILWLFRGEDFLQYDLRQNRMVGAPTSIATGWAGGNLPSGFKIGIDSAVWAGPEIPDQAFLFRGSEFIRLDCSSNPSSPQGWTVTLDPFSTANEWLRFPSPDGTPQYGPDRGPAAKLYGLRESANRVHFFFPDGQYLRHNFNNGEYDIPPTPIQSIFPLPPQFGGRVDHAFYGAGAEAEHIFFFRRFDYAQFDIKRNAIVRSGAIEQRFPALAAYLARPQLYLVEDYGLNTYVGPPTLGRLVSTLQVLPQSRRTSVVVTRVTANAALPLQQNLIEGQSQTAINDFYTRLAQATADNPTPATLARVVGARMLWTGEVDALAPSEPLDGGRNALMRAALAALADQSRASSLQVERHVVDASTAPPPGSVLNQETYELSNTGSTTREIELMELLQPYATLLLLTDIRLAYTNGRDQPVVFGLRETAARLADLLVDPATTAPIIAFLKAQLSQIQDSSGDMRSFIAAGQDLAIDARVRSVFVFDSVSPPQHAEVFGIIKAARLWQQPTYQTRAIDVSPETPDASSKPLEPVKASPSAAIAALAMRSSVSDPAAATSAASRADVSGRDDATLKPAVPPNRRSQAEMNPT